MTLSGQWSMLHAGQRRLHDYPKLRELYLQQQQRLFSCTTTSSSSLLLSLPSRRWNHNRNYFFYLSPAPGLSLHYYPLRPERTFFSAASSSSGTSNPVARAIRAWQLKRLERQANAAPHDAEAQYQFLSAVAVDHPAAVIARLRHFPNHAVNVPIAVLYLDALERTGQYSDLHPDDLAQRLIRSSHHPHVNSDHPLASASSDAMPPSVLLDFTRQLTSQKLNKAAQVQQFKQLLLSTGAGAAAAAAAAAGRASSPFMMGASAVGGSVGAPRGGVTGRSGSAAAAAASSSAAAPFLSRGWDSKAPLYIQVHEPPGLGARGFLLGLMARAALVLIFFSAAGALLDEKGLGRGGAGGGLGGMNAGSKHVQEAESNGRKVRFEDVKGVTEAKAELEEIVMYLKDPGKFTRLGGKLPRGLLLIGPPGTGKTLLAKAIAGEADVPFFYSSGSQFEEVFVGLGAKRVRELFEAAKKKAPAIIFIDEIDAVGGTRSLKDQSALKMTLNELLVQLDGFDENNGIIVIGATNFVESLDVALLRPGRFDKHVMVPLPDVGGRKEILEMYAKKTKLAKDVDLNVIARGTTGFSGADLFNLVNQAALKASVDGLNAITMSVFEYAKDKIIMGAERKSAVIAPETAKCTAYHEAGHAVVAVLTPGSQPIHKATIMPRGSALGLVAMLPEGDQTSMKYKEMIAAMDMAMGGRVAEELVFGKERVTSGALSDIQYATNIARNMVTKCGFSESVGIVFHGNGAGDEGASDKTRTLIDQEVKKLTDAAYKRAKELLMKHAAEHKLLAETLLEYETLTGDEVRDVVLRRQKPNRPVINKEGGARGDQSILSSTKTKSSSSSGSKSSSSGSSKSSSWLPGRGKGPS